MAKPYNPKSVGALTLGPTKSKFNPHFQSYFSRCSFDIPSSSVAIRFLNRGRKSFSLAGYVGQMAVNASLQHSVRSWGWPCHYCISAVNSLHSTVWLMMVVWNQVEVEKKTMKEQKKTRHDLERDHFVAEITPAHAWLKMISRSECNTI